MKKYRIVLDTNVLVAALRSRDGASFQLLSRIIRGVFEFVISTPLILEYEMVLKRSGIVPLLNEEIEEWLDILCLLGERQKLWYLWRPILSDAGDDFIAELAVNAHVDYIVTFNSKHFDGMGAFGINVCSPKTFLKLISE